MKKALLFAACLCSFAVSAQKLSVQGGVSTGSLNWEVPNSNVDLYDESTIESNFRLGFIKDLNEKQSINMGLGLLVKSGKQTIIQSNNQGNDQSSVEQNARFDYITLNALFTQRLTQGKFIPYLEIGPKLDLLIGNNDEVASVKDDFNSAMFGIVGGFGVERWFNNIAVGINGRYHYDISKMAKWDNEGQDNNVSVSGNRFTINASLIYAL